MYKVTFIRKGEQLVQAFDHDERMRKWIADNGLTDYVIMQEVFSIANMRFEWVEVETVGEAFAESVRLLKA